MSSASDKARFFLEQSVPQLQEFEQKKIFSKDEIRTLVKKRSDFEHKVLARGSRPVDFARYAAWEISLERLRQKRCKRLGIKGSSAHAGQARIFLIFHRATRKHFGDLALWMSYLQYTREVKAMKKFKIVLTAALRMHPTKAELWLYAAKWAFETESDMSAARSYMQRGTRFCTKSSELWIGYAKLEMIYLAKISLRRRILGLDSNNSARRTEIQDKMEEVVSEGAEDDQGFASSDDIIRIPDFDDQTIQPNMMDSIRVDIEAVEVPMTTPAFNGAIPLAIFDDARKQQFFSAAVAEKFFDMFALFSQVACLPKLLQHVVDSMVNTYPRDPISCNCFIRQPIIGINPLTANFPMALASSLERLKSSKEKTSSKTELAKMITQWIEPILAMEGLDMGIQKVLRYTLQKLDQ